MPISFMNSMSFCDLEIFFLGEWGYAWEDTLSHYLLSAEFKVSAGEKRGLYPDGIDPNLTKLR